MPGYYHDIRAFLSIRRSSDNQKQQPTINNGYENNNATAKPSVNPSSATTATTTAAPTEHQQQATTPGTPRRHLPWLHGTTPTMTTTTPVTATRKRDKTPRAAAHTVRFSTEGSAATLFTTTTTVSRAANDDQPRTTTTTTERDDRATATTQQQCATMTPPRAAYSHTTTPRGRGRDGGGGGGSSSYTPRSGRGGEHGTPMRGGRYANNTWYCDCGEGDRKLPAERFQVKKEGPNKRRWFYTCRRKPRDERRCEFFLWEEDARERMGAEGAVEGRQQAGGAVSSVGAGGATAAASGGGEAAMMGGAAKRKWQEEVDGEAATEDENEDEYGWGKDVGVEDAIGRVLQAVSTPSRKVLKAKDGATPGASSAVVMTPVSQRGKDGGGGDANATPTPARFGSATPSTRCGGEDDANGDVLVPEVLQLLNEKGVKLNGEADEALQKMLRSHSLRMQGLTRGRNVSRLALREKNAKVAELQARITALEAELEMHKAVIANVDWQKETGQSD